MIFGGAGCLCWVGHFVLSLQCTRVKLSDVGELVVVVVVWYSLGLGRAMRERRRRWDFDR